MRKKHLFITAILLSAACLLAGCSAYELRSLQSWTNSGLFGSVSEQTPRPDPADDFYLSVNYDRILSTPQEELGEDGLLVPGEGVSERIRQELTAWQTDGPSEETLSLLDEKARSNLTAWITLHRLAADETAQGGAAAQQLLRNVSAEIGNLTTFYGLTRWLRSENAAFFAEDLLPLRISQDPSDPSGRRWLVSVLSPRLATVGEDWTAGRRAEAASLLTGWLGMDAAAAEDCLVRAETYEKHIEASLREAPSSLYTTLESMPESGFPMLRDYLKAIGFGDGDSVLYCQEQPRCLTFLGQFTLGSQLSNFQAYLRLHALLRAEPYLTGRAETEADSVFFALPESAFIQIHFREKDISFLRSMAEQLIETYKNSLSAAGWLSDATRTEAIRRLELLTFESLSATLPDCGGLQIPEDADCLEAFRTAHLYMARAAAAAVRQPCTGSFHTVSITSLAEDPEVLDPEKSSLNLHSLLLRTEACTGKSFRNLSTEEKWAAAGTFLARELVHIFDETVVRTDSSGQIRYMWTDEERKAVREKEQDLLEYLRYKIPDDLREVPGPDGTSVSRTELIRTELAADISGVQTVLSLACQDASFRFETFFEAYAASHFELFEDVAARDRLCGTQPTEMLRVNAVLSQCAAFHETYGAAPGDGMYVPDGTLLVLWDTKEENFRERILPVFREQPDTSEYVSVRYYSDRPQTACMDIAVFYDRFVLSGTSGLNGLKVSRSGSVYTLTTDDGSRAIIDAEAGTLYSEDLTAFTDMPFYKRQRTSGAADPWFPFLRIRSITTEPSHPQAITLSFADYGLPVYGEEHSVYLPVATLADLFCDWHCFHVFFNGEAFYTYDELNNIQHTNAKDLVSDYYAPIFSLNARDSETADLAYRELCFAADHFYGWPGSAPIEALLKQKGLDRTLCENWPSVRQLLVSRSWEDYQTGLYLLFNCLLDDGGHTLYNDLNPAREQLLTSLCEAAASRLLPGFERAAVKRAREAAPLLEDKYSRYGSASYIKEGDTAMVVINSFTVDSEAWVRYYAGQGSLPVRTDTLALVCDCLLKAQNDPDVHQFAIDLSHNGGGEERALLAICSLLTGRSWLTEYNVLKGQYIRTEYEVDRNFDGRFDEKDEAVSFDLNFAVITSRLSYSCANLLPSFCRENGILLIGQTSGGGSCSCRFAQTADGLAIRFSSVQHFLNSQKESIEAGIPANLELGRASGNGQISYSGCFDLTRIGQMIREYYEKKTP